MKSFVTTGFMLAMLLFSFSVSYSQGNATKATSEIKKDSIVYILDHKRVGKSEVNLCLDSILRVKVINLMSAYSTVKEKEDCKKYLGKGDENVKTVFFVTTQKTAYVVLLKTLCEIMPTHCAEFTPLTIEQFLKQYSVNLTEKKKILVGDEMLRLLIHIETSKIDSAFLNNKEIRIYGKNLIR